MLKDPYKFSWITRAEDLIKDDKSLRRTAEHVAFFYYKQAIADILSGKIKLPKQIHSEKEDKNVDRNPERNNC